ncbi:MAG: hypothetical protein EVJ48_10370 [Candidatus Acidulodesulfobacterium acidiphilum]|uniref:Uncharacterized protein n=1 Tax=Candidatus Acidulodesulfobacterium acidiphilum TaxID=2597224 RepID=A0A520X5N6_9DELT|nr:MAG: hypothetical protein EVJ48_10370 [Candidatus Acidulodesulfobacterium acidiphilum]
MFIAELFFFAVEIFFLIYLFLKGKAIANEMRKLKLERQSVMNLKEALEENFITEIEAAKNKIIDEFIKKLYDYHFNI